jgi:phospholipase/carboxylesterase
MSTPETRLVDSGPAFERAGLVHRVRESAGAAPHPAVVMLHGRSGTEDVMWVFARALPGEWLVAAPRAIHADPDGGYSWHPRRPDEWPPLIEFDDAAAAIAGFIGALPELYGADARRIYLMGFSQGAAAAYAAALKYPKLARGIAGLVGFMPTQYEGAVAGALLNGLPVFMAAGQSDERIPVERSELCAAALRALGAELEYHLYAAGHKLDAQGMRDLTRWWTERASESENT